MLTRLETRIDLILSNFIVSKEIRYSVIKGLIIENV